MAIEIPSTSYESPAAAVSDERLRIAGLTGVQIELDLAGPGSRSYAFLIDWHIRVLLALAWLGGAWLLESLYGDPSPRGRQFQLLALLPAILIYLLYHPIVELAMRGRSPGKRMAGVRLVTRGGGTPGVSAILIRNVFRIIDGLPALYLFGLICCFVTRQRVRIGDLAAGTLLVVDAQAAEATIARLSTSLGQSALPPSLIELAQELLERWDSLEPTRRFELAQTLLARAGQDGESASDAQLRAKVRQLIPAAQAPRP
jgi:uncharacterized RDD family membrane protein YckC